jgi:stage II sporulation protein D
MVPRLLAILAAVVILTGAVAFGGEGETIRVGLCYGSNAPSSVTISGRGEGTAESAHGQFNGEVKVSADGDTLVLEYKDQRGRLGRWAEFQPTGEEPWLDLGDATYRGTLRIELERGRLKVINVVGIEEYVRGVVPNEMFSDGEANKVQAVISRTYAIYVRDIERKHRNDGFDICTTGHCQVYRGVDSERPQTDEAVEATRGEVLTYRGRPIFSSYHANAGGQTETVDEAWPGSIRANFPYLESVDSPFDGEAGTLNGYTWCYQWERDVPASEIAGRLKSWGKDVGEVRDLCVKATTSTGRVKALEVTGTKGGVTVKTPTEVRSLLQLPSPRCTISKRGDCFHVIGSGRGHGVGLSQHGALGMSRAGYRYDQILGQYYRGVALTQNYGRGESRALTPPDLKVQSASVKPVIVPPGMS